MGENLSINIEKLQKEKLYLLVRPSVHLGRFFVEIIHLMIDGDRIIEQGGRFFNPFYLETLYPLEALEVNVPLVRVFPAEPEVISWLARVAGNLCLYLEHIECSSREVKEFCRFWRADRMRL